MEADQSLSARDRAADEYARSGEVRNPINFYDFRHESFSAGWTACEAKQAERIAELEAKVKTFTLRIAKLEAVVSAARIFHDWRRDSDEVSLDIAIVELDAFDDPLGGA